MSDAATSARRKDEQIDAVLGADVASRVGTGFDGLRLRSRALPDIDLADVDLSCTFLDWELAAPLMISSTTGGSEKTFVVLRRLAKSAQRNGVALGIGSMRVAIEQPGLRRLFAVRELAPDVPIFANVGVVGAEASTVVRLCRELELDALVVHLNPLQEAIQPGGNPRYRGALAAIENLVSETRLPIIVKEVGFGLSGADVALLIDAGVSAIDVAGAGGTNWALVEGARDPRAARIAAPFADWGRPTVDALQEAVRFRDTVGSSVPIIASGGVRSGVDVAKALCLGATLVGVARYAVVAAWESERAGAEAIDVLIEQLRIAAFGCGAADRADLSAELFETPWPCEACDRTVRSC